MGIALTGSTHPTPEPHHLMVRPIAFTIRPQLSSSARRKSAAPSKKNGLAGSNQRGQVEGGNAQEGGDKGLAAIADRSAMSLT